ncbi:MAG: hypothetical protein VX278_10095 [Myxococcota bacterium]|nr:hypothetical protein [Myxococcota bacterium]
MREEIWGIEHDALRRISDRLVAGKPFTWKSVDVERDDPFYHLRALNFMHRPNIDGLDVTVVIPTQRPKFCIPNAYENDNVLLLSNRGGPIWSRQGRILRVAWEGHAKTRKQALPHIDTKYVFFTVDDAIPLRGMLSVLVQEFEKGNEQWDILCPRQVPWPHACHVSKNRLAQWMPYAQQTYPFSQADHVGAMYRTDDLRRWKLPDVPIAEDMWWSRGKRIGCIPQATIVHSHIRRPRSLFFREYAISQERAKMGEDVGVSLLDPIRAFWLGWQESSLYEGINGFSECLGRYCGVTRSKSSKDIPGRIE